MQYMTCLSLVVQKHAFPNIVYDINDSHNAFNLKYIRLFTVKERVLKIFFSMNVYRRSPPPI